MPVTNRSEAVELHFDTPIRCPILVGRSPHVAWLERCLDRACGGEGQTVCLAGEAGIGKSRLVAEAKEHARREGMLVLEGHCFEPDHAVAYAPFLDLLRTYLSQLKPGEARDRLGPAVSDLAALLPELGGNRLRPPLAPPAEPEQEKRRIFHALTQCILHLAATQPVVLIVEDLHWSDETSYELLGYMARRLAAAPVLMLLTYRIDEVGANLAHLLADLDRERLTSEVRLAPLTKDDEAAMLRAITGEVATLPAGLLDVVYSLTEGNPFFVEEIARSLLTDSSLYEHPSALSLDQLAIPRTIEDAVRRRSQHLSAEADRVLAAAAVAGRRVDFALLQALIGCDEQALLDRIKELIAAQVVVEESADRFAFRHALTRQAIYAGLLARERRILHRQIAETIELVYAETLDAHVADLAHHWFEAADWSRALEHAQRAGEQAILLFAPGPAIVHLTQAIEAASRLGEAPSPVLHRRLAFGYELLGDFDRARDGYEQALTIASSTGNRREESEALFELGQLWAQRDYARTGEYVMWALVLARDIADPIILARSLNRAGNWHANTSQPGVAEQHHAEALAIFEQLGNQRGIARSLDLLAMAAHLRGDAIKSTELYLRAVALAEEANDRWTLTSSLAMLAVARGGPTSPAVVPAPISFYEVVNAAKRAQRIASEIGWQAAEAFAWKNVAECSSLPGRYGDAFIAIRESLQIVEEIGHRQWMAAANTVVGVLFLDLLALPPARRHLEQAVALAYEIGSAFWIGVASGWLGSTLVAQGELDAAEAVLDRALGRDAPTEIPQQRCVWVARAQLALARGDPANALDIVDLLLATTVHLDLDDLSPAPALATLRGEALAGLGRPAEAEAALRAAQTGAAANGWRPLLWRAQRALGALLRSQRRHDEAQREFAAAREIINELAATVDDEVLRESFLEQATAALPRERSPSPRQVAREALGGLTEREHEVAMLVSQGQSNREIAASLFVGERTVASHVHNILSKLEFTSRAQIARWVTERSLHEPGDPDQS